MDGSPSFSESLRDLAEPLWKTIHAHPFVTGIGDGSLPEDRFRFYMRQDYLFLIEYSRVTALAVAKAPHLEDMGRFADLLNATLNTEMDLHRGFAAKFGISAEEFETARHAPACRAYTDYLLTTPSFYRHTKCSAFFPCAGI